MREERGSNKGGEVGRGVGFGRTMMVGEGERCGSGSCGGLRFC